MDGWVRRHPKALQEWEMTRLWSRMASAAVFTLLVGTPFAASHAQEPVASTVQLRIQINGVSSDGCKVRIRPGHPGCKFQPVERQVQGYAGGEAVQLDPISLVASTIGADRDCSFEIILEEPGQPPRKFRRGMRLNPPEPEESEAKLQTLTVYLSTASLAARELPGRIRR